MKKVLLGLFALSAAQLSMAQLKTYDLYVVAEGNFGSPNGDVFRASRIHDTTHTYSGGMFQSANGTVGIDVLQDYGVFGNKAVLCGKGGSSSVYKLSIVSYPSFDSLKTFQSTGGIQTVGKASNDKAYLSMATGSSMQLLDLNTFALTPVSDPNALLSSAASYMVQANGYMYASFGTKIVKIDTLTNTATASLLPGIGAIAGMQYDAVNNCIWLLGKVSGVSSIVKLEPSNNDLLSTPIQLTGITTAAQLRLARNKLYFLAGKNVYAYNIAVPNIPTPVLYTSNLAGNAFSFAYGKSFDVDPNTGDFAVSTAGNYAQPSQFEIVDGTTFQVIDTGSVTGRIANELELHTYIIPVPDTATLQDVYAQCSVTLDIPTAHAGSIEVQGVTDFLNYDGQGTHQVTWTFTNGYETTTYTQQVIIDDTTAPVPDTASLAALHVSCPYTLQPPTATDNCSGAITGTTDSLTFTTAGAYEVVWHYNDGNGNTATQTQQVQVSCTTGIQGAASFAAALKVFPNPATRQVQVHLDGYKGAKPYRITLRNAVGQTVCTTTTTTAQNTVSIGGLPAGLYLISISQDGSAAFTTRLVIE